MPILERIERATNPTRAVGYFDPLVAQLTHLPFPEVAEALRAAASPITDAWDAACREAMPQMRHLTHAELRDSTPEILMAIAAALASDDPAEIRELVRHAPAQGLSRLRLNFDVIEVMQEDRLLRAITVQHVEAELGRRMGVAESAALHAAVDIMLQRSVIALVDEQKVRLRAAAARELKFLSFLTHDLNNNLNNVSLLLSGHEVSLKRAGDFPEAVESLRLARRSIVDTVTGMRRMLEHERMRASGQGPTFSPVDVQQLATGVVLQFVCEAEAKGVGLRVDVLPDAVVESDGELLLVVLQNLVGNGVKFSSKGTVRVGFDGGFGARSPALWVSDEGPGIAPERLDMIFEAFGRGDVHGQAGVGLGLAIASQGARLLGADLTVESEVGAGSTFRITFGRAGESDGGGAPHAKLHQ